uniref:Uncharacterized protein n=1 Tax=Arundo donax TaxID=35708 RepID=A0A0A9FDY5_ARUDO
MEATTFSSWKSAYLSILSRSL